MATVQEALDRLWSDEGLKQRLFSDPKPVLKEFGLDIPQNVKVHVHENNNKVFNAVLPAKPESKVSLGTDALSQIIERAWSDASFKKKLLSDPKEAAAEMGVKLPQNIDVKIWENTETDEHIVLPANPVETELSEMELEAVSGGLSKGNQVASGCGAATTVAGTVAATLAFSAIGSAITGVVAATAGGGSAAGGVIASNNSKC